METLTIDARGLACPQPVVLTKNALDSGQGSDILVLVDTEVARDNVVRHAQQRGCSVNVAAQGQAFAVRIAAPAGIARAARQNAPLPTCAASSGGTVVLLDADFIGSNRELGKLLVNGLLKATAALEGVQGCVILISNGVRLAVEGSYALEALGQLSERGFGILICGTCVDFFKIRDKVMIGKISNALEIMEAMTQAAQVIKL